MISTLRTRYGRENSMNESHLQLLRRSFLLGQRSSELQRRSLLVGKRSSELQRRSFLVGKRSSKLQRWSFLVGKGSSELQRRSFLVDRPGFKLQRSISNMKPPPFKLGPSPSKLRWPLSNGRAPLFDTGGRTFTPGGRPSKWRRCPANLRELSPSVSCGRPRSARLRQSISGVGRTIELR